MANAAYIHPLSLQTLLPYIYILCLLHKAKGFPLEAGDTTQPRQLQSERFFAEGGYQSEVTPCAVPWIYVGEDGERREVSTACVTFEELEPYIGRSQPPEEPVDERTSTSSWCSTDDEYVKNPAGNNKARRKNWGYCLDTATRSPSVAPSAVPSLSPSIAPSQPVYLADGGGVQSGVCILPFTVDGVVFTECAKVEEVSPYFPAEEFAPQYAATDKSSWCAVDFEEYIKEPDGADKSRRKMWGYCVKETEAVTPSNSFFADGGFQDTLTPCASSWQFKEKVDGQSIIHDTSATCIPFSERQPYGYQDPEVSLLDPTESTTNTNLWCSTSAVYNPTPERDVTNRKNWGFCFSSDATSAPTSPTAPVAVTAAPTAAPQVDSGSPTASPVSAFFADGGFQVDLVDCAETWQFKEKVDGESVLHEVSGTCISFSERQPYGYDDESVTLLGPTEPTTNRDLWCSTTSVYNANPERDVNNRENWGYCYSASFTLSPTIPVAPTGPTTTSPSASPSTPQPSTSPTTSQPTITSPIGDGGGVEGGTCLIPFTDVRSGQVFNDCASITDFPPHIGNNPFAPVYAETDQTKWCAVEFDEYIAEPTTPDKSRRKKWAYCLNPFANRTRITAQPTTPIPTPFRTQHSADGGGQQGIRPCAEEWSYKVRDDDGKATLIEMDSQCVSFDNYEPGGYGDGSAIDPTDPRTDRTRWCATASVYNPEPQGEDNADNKLLWGFCLDESLTPSPTQLPIAAATAAPNADSTAPSLSPVPGNVPSAAPSTLSNAPSAAPVVAAGSSQSPTSTPSTLAGNISETAQPSVSPTGDVLEEQIADFVKEVGITSWSESETLEEVPMMLQQEGVTSAAWDASTQSLRMRVDKGCDANVISAVYQALKAMYSTFDYSLTCRDQTGRRLQDNNSTDTNGTSTSSEVVAQVCTDGSCTDNAGSSEPISTNNLIAIVVPSVLVGLVAIGTAVYVVKKRRAMRKQRDGVIYNPPRERKSWFRWRKASAPKRPRVLLKRSSKKKEQSEESVVASAGEKGSDGYSYGGSGPNGTSEVKPETETDQPRYHFTPEESAQETAEQEQTTSFATSTEAKETADNETSYHANLNPSSVETHVESTAEEEKSSKDESSKDKRVQPTVDKDSSESLKKKSSSSGKSKKNLTKVQCEKCSSTFYSASGKKKCLKCRDDKRKKSCEKCGANFISVSGKSTLCTNCRKGAKGTKEAAKVATSSKDKANGQT